MTRRNDSARKVIPRLAVVLPDGTHRHLDYAITRKHSLREGMRLPFSRYPLVTCGEITLRYDETLQDWKPTASGRKTRCRHSIATGRGRRKKK